MRYSLISPSVFYPNNKVSGNWIQDVYGTLDDAIERAVSYSKVNSDKVNIIVCKGTNGTGVGHSVFVAPLWQMLNNSPSLVCAVV